MPTVHYLEIVTSEIAATRALYEALWGVSFGEAVAELGQAVTAKRLDGTLVGIRKPMADHEAPTIRTYVTVDDIAAAVKAAEVAGAKIAYPPTQQGAYGTFAIVIVGGAEHGLWEA